MFRQKEIILLTLIICNHLFSVAKAEIESKAIKVYVTEGVEMLVDKSSYSSPGMVFGMCSYSGGLYHEYFCTLVLETTKPIDSADHLKACNITLNAGRAIPSGIKNVVAFGVDKAILQWRYEDSTNAFAILHFSNCKHYVVENGYAIFNVINIVPSDETFSIIMRNLNWQQSTCKTGRDCMLTFDDKGEIITGLVPWAGYIFDGAFNDIINSPLKNNLIVHSTYNKTEIGHISDGKFIVLKTFNRENMMDYDTTSTSKTQNLLTVCYPNNKDEVRCGQFDLNGNLKFETQIDMTITGHTSLAVFNLPGGGFLLVDDHCSMHGYHRCDAEYQSCFTMRKINAHGKTAGCKKITCQLQHEYSMNLKKMHFHINENGKNCISYPITSRQEGFKYSIDFYVLCFDNEELYPCDY